MSGAKASRQRGLKQPRSNTAWCCFRSSLQYRPVPRHRVPVLRGVGCQANRRRSLVRLLALHRHCRSSWGHRRPLHFLRAAVAKFLEYSTSCSSRSMVDGMPRVPCGICLVMLGGVRQLRAILLVRPPSHFLDRCPSIFLLDLGCMGCYGGRRGHRC